MCSKPPPLSIAVSVVLASLYFLKSIMDYLQLSNLPPLFLRNLCPTPFWDNIGGTCTVYHKLEPPPPPAGEAKSGPTSFPYLFTNLSIPLRNASKSYHIIWHPLLSSLLSLPSLLCPTPDSMFTHACTHTHRPAKSSLLVSLMLFFRNSGLHYLGGTACCSSQ